MLYVQHCIDFCMIPGDLSSPYLTVTYIFVSLRNMFEDVRRIIGPFDKHLFDSYGEMQVSHYCDVIMGAIVTQITNLTIYTDADQIKISKLCVIVFCVRNSPVPFYDVIMHSPHWIGCLFDMISQMLIAPLTDSMGIGVISIWRSYTHASKTRH